MKMKSNIDGNESTIHTESAMATHQKLIEEKRVNDLPTTYQRPIASITIYESNNTNNIYIQLKKDEKNTLIT